MYMWELGVVSIYVSICIGILMFVNSPFGFSSLLVYVSNLRICDSVSVSFPVPVSVSLYFPRFLQFLLSSRQARHEGGL